MIKILHRGDTKKYLENTIESIASAINNQNYQGIEIDIQLTKDNKWIIFHDINLKRLTGIDKNINDINYKDLPIINYKNKIYKISLFEELIKLDFKNKILDIEIKTESSCLNNSKIDLFNIIKKIKTIKFISSFIWEWNIWCKEKNIKFGYLIENNILPKIDNEIENLFILDYNILNKKIIEKLNQKKKLKYGCYTLNKKINKSLNFYIEIWDN